MEHGGAFDASVGQEWQSFEQRLAAWLEQMVDPDLLGLAGGTGVSSPGHLLFRATGAGTLVLGLADQLIAAAAAPVDVRLDQWSTERGPDGLEVAWLAKRPGHGTELAVVASSILRATTFSPEFVRVTVPSSATATFRAGQHQASHEPESNRRSATTSRAGDGLTTQVVKAVARFLDAKPRVDEHGDLVIDRWQSPVYVRVAGPRATLEKRERVTVFAHLPVYLGHDAASAQTVATVDAELSDLRVRLEGDACVLSADVPTDDVAGRLPDALVRLGSSIDDVRDRIGERLAGVGEAERTPPELLCLIELVADGGEPLQPDEVAQVCRHDRDLLLAFLDRCAREVRTAGQAFTRVGADTGEAEELGAELDAWRQLRTLLRSALRTVVLQPQPADRSA